MTSDLVLFDYKFMKEKDIKFREKVLIKLILKAALKKKERLKNAFSGESHIPKGQNMN